MLCNFVRSVLGIVSLSLYAGTTPPLMAQDRDDDDGFWGELAIEEGPQSRATIDSAAEVEVVDTIPVPDLQPAAAQEPRRGSRLIEEIVVTAQKREENLQDVPISIQAYSADALDAQGILDIASLPRITPGLTITNQVAYVTTYIRGVGSDAFLLADPSVATYYDGVYQPFPNGLIQDFGEIDRVEVLKGPQGTLFGRNAVGGAVNIVTRAPDLSEWHLGLQASVQSHDTYKNRVYLSAPLWEDALAVSISAVYNDGENHIDGTAGGQPLDRQRAKGGRLQLRWVPAEWMDLQLTALDINNTGPGTSYQPNASPSSLLGAIIEPQDPYRGEVNEPLFYNHDNELYYGQLSFSLPRFDVRLLGSTQKANSFFNYDFDSSPVPLALFQIDNVFVDAQSAELQILSNQDSWGANRLQWIAGLYFFDSRTGFDPSFLRVVGTNPVAGLLLGQEVPGLAAFFAQLPGLPIPTGDINFFGILGTRSLAGYAQATWRFSESMSLTVGARYQDEERRLVRSSSELRTANGGLITIQDYRDGETPLVLGGVPSENAGPPLNDTTTSFDPKVGLEYRPNRDWLGREALLYANWQTATKSSTYNTVNIYNPPDLVRPEDITAYEIGLKTSLFGGAMRFNIAAFDYEIKDQQVQFISLLAGGAVTFENAGNVAVRGFEIDSLTQVLPSRVDDLVATLGLSVLEAKYENYTNGSGFGEQGVLTQNNDFSGNKVVRSPDFTGNVGLSKTFHTRIGSIEFGSNYYYNSGFFYSAENTRAASEDSYQLLSAHLSWLIERWDLRLTMFGENLTDEEYSFGKFPSDFGVGDARAPKAVYGFRLSLNL